MNSKKVIDKCNDVSSEIDLSVSNSTTIDSPYIVGAYMVQSEPIGSWPYPAATTTFTHLSSSEDEEEDFIETLLEKTLLYKIGLMSKPPEEITKILGKEVEVHDESLMVIIRTLLWALDRLDNLD